MFKNLRKIKSNRGLPAMPTHARQAGMTLIELLVVLAIFMIVTGLTIFNYGSFRSSASITNLAEDIALSIRKAQSYAIGVHSYNSSFLNGYGIHFTTQGSSSNPLTGSNKSFIIFTDSNADKAYNYPSSGTCGVGIECNEILSITSADSISGIYLNGSNTATPIGSSIDISFKRPNADAYFCYKTTVNPTSTCTSDNTSISNVQIKVSNDQGGSSAKSHVITVWNTGQISVQ